MSKRASSKKTAAKPPKQPKTRKETVMSENEKIEEKPIETQPEQQTTETPAVEEATGAEPKGATEPATEQSLSEPAADVLVVTPNFHDEAFAGATHPMMASATGDAVQPPDLINKITALPTPELNREPEPPPPPAPTPPVVNRFAVAKSVAARADELVERAAGGFLPFAEIGVSLREVIPASVAGDDVILKITELSGGLPYAAFRLAKMALRFDGALTLEHVESVRKDVARAMLSADPRHIEWLRLLAKGIMTGMPADAGEILLQWQLLLMIPNSDPAQQATVIIHPIVTAEL